MHNTWCLLVYVVLLVISAMCLFYANQINKGNTDVPQKSSMIYWVSLVGVLITSGLTLYLGYNMYSRGSMSGMFHSSSY